VIFQPAIIALLLASALCVLALAASAPFALEVIRRWDIGSGSERQLQLERRTYLFSTLLTFVLVLQLAAVLLFVFNAEKMSGMFVGAMCAVGTLNVNAFGFPALNAKIAVFFLAAMWLAINHVDSRARDYPLVRIKYALLLALAPLLLASGWVELQYFLGLKADVITSCCGSLFSEGSPTLAAEASSLPPLPAMWLFYGSLGAAIAAAAWHGYGGGRSRAPVRPELVEGQATSTSSGQASTALSPNGPGWAERSSGYALAAASLVAFAATIAGILSFVSLYIYEHPNHHCPFCILKPEYGYQGYWLYVPLFGATAAGLAAGAIQPFARIASLRDIVPGFSRNLAAIAANGFALTAVIATAMIWQSRLILLEH